MRLLLSDATARACLPVAIVVGTVVSPVKQGDVIAQGVFGAVVALKVPAHDLIPFLTSSTGAPLDVREPPARSRAGSR